MAKALFYPIGNSDIQVNSHLRFERFYEVTQKLAQLLKDEVKKCNGKLKRISQGQGIEFQFIKEEIEDLQGKANTITFPIFAPLMEHLKNRGIDSLYLIATSQQPSPQRQDTIWAAELIKIYAQQSYKISKVEIIKITNNPSDYNLMSKFFKDLFKQMFPEINTNLENYAFLTTGTPAMTTSIALNMVSLPVKHLYVSREDSKIYEVNVFSELNRERYIAIVTPLILNYEYGQAIKVIQQSPLRANFQLVNLLEVMKERVLFNFDKAMELIHLCQEELRKEFTDLSNLAQKEEKAILLEFLALIELNFKKGDYLILDVQVF